MSSFAIRELIRKEPHYRALYDLARKSRDRKTSVYDISSTCNLFCEGCLFFDRDGNHDGTEDKTTLDQYRQLFLSERARGVNYPLLAGAEPSLRQDILRVAAEVWTQGMVHTNGIKKIDPALPFRLYVSCWGGPKLTELWRGADCYHKMLDNVTGDPRAIINYTINRYNIGDIPQVVADCAARDIPITFQIYSPTDDYSDFLNSGRQGDHQYIQGAVGSDDDLALTVEHDKLAEATLLECLERFPDTVVLTEPIIRWMFKGPNMFVGHRTTDPQRYCQAALDKTHQHNLLGGGRETTKTCGHASVNCNTCRLYTTIFHTFLQHSLEKMKTMEDARQFLEGHRVFGRVYDWAALLQKKYASPMIARIPSSLKHAKSEATKEGEEL